jgi:RNA polymerase sigma-70 factor (ECF subfamily)
LVLAAGHGGSAVAREAMAQLCQLYWYPLYAYARRQGADADAARDLTQGFFEHLLEHELVARAEASRGRFRSYLLQCFKNFASSERARARREKRGGGDLILSLDVPGMEQRFAGDLADGRDPESLYERQWALAVVEEALRRLRQEFVVAGRERTFTALAPRLTGDPDGVSSRELARELGTTEGTVDVMVHRLRRQYREALSAVVLRTVASPAEVEEELRYLLRVLQAR